MRVVGTGIVLVLLSLAVGPVKQTLALNYVVNFIAAGMMVASGAAFLIDRGVMFVVHWKLHRLQAKLARMAAKPLAGNAEGLPFEVLCAIVRAPDGEAGLWCGNCWSFTWSREAVEERTCHECGRVIALRDTPP